MAFPLSNNQREIANRKLLEDLHLKKQILLKQGTASTLNPSALPLLGSAIQLQGIDTQPLNSHHQKALIQANAQSTGYFISQDSAFGLTISNKNCSEMKLKQLESHLSSIEPFKKPKILLEQYVTPPHLAACMLDHIQSEHDGITDKIVADLGCGAGCLTIGAAILGASVVYGFEIDTDALDVLQENVEEFELPNIEIIHCDVRKIPPRFNKFFDTVIMNPPFGTKHNAGIDMEFLEAGVRLANSAVYSLHKTSTRKHVLKYGETLGREVKVVAELKFNLSSTYKFHKKKSVDIEVDLIKISV